MRKQEHFIQTNGLGEIEVEVTRHVIHIPAQFNVPYEGGLPQVQATFPDGFPPSYGSGLAFKSRTPQGLAFYCLTDRGPNGDGPLAPLGEQGSMGGKIFPAPSFMPSIGVLQVDAARAHLVASMPIRMEDGSTASGLPLPQGVLGNSGEIPLGDQLRFDPDSKVGFHAHGIDSEAIAFDARGNCLWITDEYGPFLLKIDPVSGVVQRRFGPGSGLPQILAKRRPNRGMEGMTFDPESGRIHAFLQSPLSDGEAHHAASGRAQPVERFAAFLRWVEFDPVRGETARMMAYPLDADDFDQGRTGNAKLGDVAAIGGGKFIVIEQGEGPDGHMFNLLVLVDTEGASDIAAWGSELERSSMAGAVVDGADWSVITPMRKTTLLDLNRIGWVAEKAEGLALVDECTLAITNDNDFGMKTRMFDADGNELAQADVTEVQVEATGDIVNRAGASIRVGHVADKERPLSLWLLRFRQPFAMLKG